MTFYRREISPFVSGVGDDTCPKQNVVAHRMIRYAIAATVLNVRITYYITY